MHLDMYHMHRDVCHISLCIYSTLQIHLFQIVLIFFLAYQVLVYHKGLNVCHNKNAKITRLKSHIRSHIQYWSPLNDALR